MATAKKTTQAAPAKKTTKAAAPAGIRPIKDTFTKGALTNHLAEQSGVEPKAVKAVLAALEATVLGAVNKKGAGEFTAPSPPTRGGATGTASRRSPPPPRRRGTGAG